jgi:TldD protein
MEISVSSVAGIVKEQLARMVGAGGSFADARFYDEGSDEWLFLRDGNAEGNQALRERGIGVRVMIEGAWGFAATADLTAIPHCFDLALANSRAAAILPGFRKDLGTPKPTTGKYAPPVARDPYEVPLRDKLGFLKDLDAQLMASFVEHRMLASRFQRRRIFYWNSEGTEIDRGQSNLFAWMVVMAPDKEGRSQRRSHELSSDGSGTCGFEWLTNAECFGSHTERVKSELSQLLVADAMPGASRDVILLPGMAWLQVHETIGHALELDRILGYELSFAGGSFVRPEMIGKLQYGSPKLTARAGVVPNSPGTFGFDDEGSPQRDYLLIDKGILVNVLSSRTDLAEANAKAGREVVKESGTAARACAFYRPPIDRMTNINVDPGSDGTLEDIVAATEDGVILDSATSPSIGSNREHFHFGCEIAWEVKNGKRTRVFRNPTYHGHTIPFWNSLDKVGDRSTWRLWPVDSCGKGEPNQIMELGHGVPVMRFHGVETGEKE